MVKQSPFFISYLCRIKNKMRLFLFFSFLCFGFGQRNNGFAQAIAVPLNVSGMTKTINSIQIEGNKKTKSSVILREMSIQVGDNLRGDSLEQILKLNFQRLYNLNLFTEINFQAINDRNDLAGLVIMVQLKEQWFILPQADIQLADRNVNVWWDEHKGDLSRINLGLYLQHKNLTGHLDKLSISTHVGYTQQLSASYFRPYIDQQQKQGIGFGLGYSRSREIAYATDNNKLQFTRHNQDFLYHYFFANAAWYYRAAYHTRHILSAGFNSYKVGDTVVQLNPDYFEQASKKLRYLEIAYRYEYNGVDNWNYPRKGLKIVGTAASRWGIEGMKYQGVATVEMGFFHRIHNRWLSSAVLRGRTTFSQEQAYFMQTAMGYKSNYVRGYEYYVVEANHFAIGRLSLKYEALRKRFDHVPFRYLPILPLWVYPKIFIDGGYAANNKQQGSNSLANTFLYAIGAGVDIITAYDLKLRIEFAYNHLGENGLYLHANSE